MKRFGEQKTKNYVEIRENTVAKKNLMKSKRTIDQLSHYRGT